MRDLVLILMFAALPANPAIALDDTVTVQLEAQGGSGQTGSATLSPEGKRTRVIINLSGGQAGTPQPVHIHLGTCANLDKAPKWPLQPVKDGRSVTTVPVSLDTILKEPSAVNVHKSAAEAQVYVACGNIIAPS